VKLLLDTHTLLWAAHEPGKLSIAAASAIRSRDNDVFVSPVSAIEIATKDRKGKLEYDTDLAHRFVADVMARGFELLSISGEHAERAGRYSAENQDPWDRLLAAQAQINGLTLVSCDGNMSGFGVATLW
jgi:PIN domain nuclease of toxin-antitoxin system